MNLMEEKKLGFGCMRMPVLDAGKADSFDYEKSRLRRSGLTSAMDLIRPMNGTIQNLNSNIGPTRRLQVSPI